jgi:hypothetical protein
MDDDGTSKGLSGWAGVALGRMWAEHDRSMEETADWFANRHRRAVDPAAVLAENQALAAENARLRQELAAYKLNFNNLRAWADSAEKTLQRLGALRD